MRVRMAHITQNLENEEGRKLITEDIIKYAIENHKVIEKYAYILHDKDYKQDEKKKYVLDEKGEKVLVAKHFHVVLKFSTPVDIENIAKWFNVPTNFVECKYKGRYAFVDNCTYLTHEKYDDKHQYEDNEVKCNFDFRSFLNENLIMRMKNSRNLKDDVRDEYRRKVMFEGMTLKQAREENKQNYANDYKYLQGCRNEYLSNMPSPDHRTNYYICGGGGVGKGLCSIALARSLFPQLENDEEIFFAVGGDNVTFENYDGQPVIIWNDCRAIELLKKLGGRGNLFDLFDPFPKAQNRQNIKYSSIRLLNRVNIVNSVDSYFTFLNGLAGEYGDYKVEDKTQAYRRFGILIPLHAEDFDLLINRGYLGDGPYDEYKCYARIKGNFRKLHEIYGDKAETVKMFENKMISPVVEGSRLIEDKKRDAEFMRNHIDDVAEILSYGEIIEGDNIKKNINNNNKKKKKIDLNADNLFNEFEGNDDKNNIDIKNLF